MTNKEAAEMIRNDMKLHHDSLSGGYRKVLSMAISALQEQEAKHSTTQKGLDTISRQAAKEAYCKKFCHPGVLCPDSGFCREVDEAFDPVPSAQPEIINCRECKHLEYDSIFDGHFCKNRRVKLDHYCGYAERRTDGRD